MVLPTFGAAVHNSSPIKEGDDRATYGSTIADIAEEMGVAPWDVEKGLRILRAESPKGVIEGDVVQRLQALRRPEERRWGKKTWKFLLGG